jgi:hypothetical protein
MRIRLPAGSRKAQSRTPYGCSVGSWTTSAAALADLGFTPMTAADRDGRRHEFTVGRDAAAAL